MSFAVGSKGNPVTNYHLLSIFIPLQTINTSRMTLVEKHDSLISNKNRLPSLGKMETLL